ncbi:hypothetical protein BKI52_10550 [marine bacterium AO1-C]|nr:hypothetical protein BKI52_10550 [marine bacterium AO1-C]
MTHKQKTMTQYHFRLLFSISFSLGLFLWMLSGCQNARENAPKKLFDIAPPFRSVTIAPKKITINPTQAQVVRFDGGMQIDVPANAFVDAQGKVVKTAVTLNLEVYDTHAKILASGIPMTFDDGKTRGHFESAGMFQLTGTSQGKKVNIAKDKTLGVNYPSMVSGDDFDFFYFEEQPENGMPTTMAQVGAQQLILPKQEKIRKGQWKKLTTNDQVATKTLIKEAPKGVDEFLLKFNTDSVPALEELEKVRWQLATTYKNPNTKLYHWVLKKKWDYLEVSQPKYITGNPIYTIPLTSDNPYPYMLQANSKGERIVLAHNNQVIIFDQRGKIVHTIPNVPTAFGAIQLYQDKYLVVRRGAGSYLYDLQGNQLGDYPDAKSNITFSFEKDRAVYETYALDNEEISDYKYIRIRDLKGHNIKVLRLEDDSYAEYDEERPFVHTDFLLMNQHLVTNSPKGIQIFDINGQLLKHKKGPYQSIEKIEETTILMRKMDGGLKIWDFITNKEVDATPGSININYNPSDSINFAARVTKIPKHPILTIQESNKWDQAKFWNYETNVVTKVNFYTNAVSTANITDSTAPYLIGGYNQQKGTYYLYNVLTNQILKTLPNYKLPAKNYLLLPAPKKSIQLKRILINGKNQAQMLDWNGQLVMNFKQYDSETLELGFTENQQVYTISSNGTYRIWDRNGNLLSTQTREDYKNELIKQQKNQVTERLEVDNGKRAVKKDYTYYISGNFHHHMEDILQKGDSLIVVQRNRQRMDILPVLKRPEQVYKLTLHSVDNNFYTYVYLNNVTQRLIKKHRSAMLKLYGNLLRQQVLEIKQREKRIQDFKKSNTQLIRSFQIKEFGIYNWDRLLKEEGQVPFVASFDFGKPVDHNLVVIYLISEVDGKIVIPFYKDSWEYFSINPDASNKLLAILPDNQIALLDSKALGKIDWQKVKSAKAYKFNMSISKRAINQLNDLNKLLQ